MSTMSDQEKIDVFRTMAQAWHDQDWDTCASLFAADGVLHSVMLQPVVGRQTIYDRIVKLGGAHKKVTLDIHRIGCVGDTLFVERTDIIVINGKRGECPVVGVLQFEDGKIKLWRDYYDRATLVEAAGYATNPPQH